MKYRRWIILAVATALMFGIIMLLKHQIINKSIGSKTDSVSVMAVQVGSPLSRSYHDFISASGDVVAWQDDSISADIGGSRLLELKADVGDKVKAGQVLALLEDSFIKADLSSLQAQQTQAKLALQDATSNFNRVKPLQNTGAISQQDFDQYAIAEKNAKVNLDSVNAQLVAQQLRLKYSVIRATDDGVITSRNVVKGAVVAPGQELFRLMRQGKMEWYALVSSADLSKLQIGDPVEIKLADVTVKGRVRMLAPTIDASTRNALVYVSLEQSANTIGKLFPGLFTSGKIILQQQNNLTVPHNAVIMSEGNSYVYLIDKQQRVKKRLVQLGPILKDSIVILHGLVANDQIVIGSGEFLQDGYKVKVITEKTVPASNT